MDGRLMGWRVAAEDIVPVGAAVAVVGGEDAERRVEDRRKPTSRQIPPRTRAYAKSKGLGDDTIAGIRAE